MKKIRALTFATALALTGSGCNQEALNREVTKLKACPDNYRASCLSPDQAAKKEQEAQQLEKQRKYKEAGLIYVELGKFNDAKRMMGECMMQGLDRDSESIYNAINFRQDVFGQLETEK